MPPKSFNQIKKDYFETPFWLFKFQPGSQITIIEDLPKNKPLRQIMKPSTKGGPAFAVNLIKITDGFVEKDLELSDSNAQLLFCGLPENIQNLKGVTLANDNNRWVFVSQADASYNENFKPKSAAIAASMEHPDTPPEPTGVGTQIRMLHQAMELNQSVGTQNTAKEVIAIAEKIRPGDALGLIKAAKDQGWITETNGIFRAE